VISSKRDDETGKYIGGCAEDHLTASPRGPQVRFYQLLVAARKQ